jgi:4-aminobutyrate---pyruvate transaminase
MDHLLPNSMHARDVASLLHPNTNAREHERLGPMIIEKGSGIFVYDDAGAEYIEGLAGLWSVAVGFGEKRLADAAYRQLLKMPYYHSFTHKANEPAITLADRLIAMAPGKMSKAFFTSSGSEANDTVIKMIWYANNALGRPKKKKIISRIRAYHGITVGAGSLTGLPIFHSDFDLPIQNVLHTLCPHHYRYGQDGESEEEFADRCASELEQLILANGPDTVAAFIGEPLMAAGGVIPPPKSYWEKIQAVCKRYDVWVVADEVITGFGRLGVTFGSEHYQIEPDFLVCSKQITSSYMPLAAVLIGDQIYQAIADNSQRIGSFGHGFTATGHPVACAVALENLDIIEERKLVRQAARSGRVLQAGLQALASHPLVGEARGVGLIGALELVADKASKRSFDPAARVGPMVFEAAHGHGLIIRAIGDTIACCPPLIITEDQVREMLRRLALALDDVWQQVRV